MTEQREFYKEITVVIEDGAQETRLTMRPIYIKELYSVLKLLDRFNEARAVSEEHLEEVQADSVKEILSMLQRTIDTDIMNLNPQAVGGLFDAFIKLNFPTPEKATRGKVRQSVDGLFDQDSYVAGFDFLIHQGHTFGDIQNYTLAQFNLFVDKAVDRLNGYKKQKSKEFLKDPLKHITTGTGVAVKRN